MYFLEKLFLILSHQNDLKTLKKINFKLENKKK
jgi:hypothetical protein